MSFICNDFCFLKNNFACCETEFGCQILLVEEKTVVNFTNKLLSDFRIYIYVIGSEGTSFDFIFNFFQ